MAQRKPFFSTAGVVALLLFLGLVGWTLFDSWFVRASKANQGRFRAEYVLRQLSLELLSRAADGKTTSEEELRGLATALVQSNDRFELFVGTTPADRISGPQSTIKLAGPWTAGLCPLRGAWPDGAPVDAPVLRKDAFVFVAVSDSTHGIVCQSATSFTRTVDGTTLPPGKPDLVPQE